MAKIEADLIVDTIIQKFIASVAVSIFSAKILALLLLKRVLCIYYPMQFKKNQAKIQTLLDSGSEVNAITPAYIIKLSFTI